jgi:ParB/RepB/Spo0J family partition protein
MEMQTAKQSYAVPVWRIRKSANQRQEDNQGFSEASLRSLADSIAEEGLNTPVTVRPVQWCAVCDSTQVGGGMCCGQARETRYELVAGDRRFRACTTLLGWETIPAFIEEMDDARARVVMALENIGRVNLNPMEEAAVYWEMTTVLGFSIEKTAERCATTYANVVARLDLLKLVPQAQELVRRGILPLTHANELTRYPDFVQHEALKLLGKTAVPFVQFKQYLVQVVEKHTTALAFDFTDFWAQQVQAAADQQEAMRSRTADLCTSDALPEVRGEKKDTAGDIAYRYMRDLEEAGLLSEAAAVGNLLERLLELRKVKNFRENPDFEPGMLPFMQGM